MARAMDAASVPPGPPGWLASASWRPAAGGYAYRQVGEEDDSEDEGAAARPPRASGLCERVEKLTETDLFHLTAAAAIALNVVSMALQANYPSWPLKPHCESHCGNVWLLVNALFLLFFTAELLLRLSAGREFFCGRDRAWNWFDFVVITVSWLVQLTVAMGVQVRAGSAVAVLRLFRVLRILRAVRLIRQLSKLRLLVRGLIESLNIVLWILMLLLGIIMAMAIFCTTLIGHSAQEWGESEEDIRLYFGSFTNSTITLFQYLTLDDWSNISRLVMEVMPWTLAIFLLYVIVAALVIMSLFSGVMAEHMNTVREQELADEQKHQQEELVGAMMIMHKAFRTADEQGDHLITKAEFVAMTEHQELRAQLATAGIDLSDLDAGELFECFDEAGRGALSWDEFNAGMEGVREGATPKQFFKLLATLRRVIFWEGQAQSQARHLMPVEQELARSLSSMAHAERRLEVLKDELESFLQEDLDAD